MSIPQKKLKSRYHEIYYKDIHTDRKTLTVWAWYNFDEGYGIVKSYIFDHRHSGATMRSDALSRFNPTAMYLHEVAASKEDVHGVIDWAIRIVSNAGKTWGQDNPGKELYETGAISKI
jgi:hypothetical protein